MLKTIEVDLIVTDPVVVNEDNIIDGFDNSEVDRENVGVKTAKSKSQDKKQRQKFGKNIGTKLWIGCSYS